MVNHMRTLWINTGAAQQARYSSVYVDPQFAPVTLTAYLRDVDRILFPRDLESRIALADDLAKLCAGDELVTYLNRFDSRSTIAAPQVNLVTLLRTPASSLLNTVLARMANYPGMPGMTKVLFTCPAYQADLDMLFSVWTHPCEGVLRIAAMALAFGYQLQALSTGGKNA